MRIFFVGRISNSNALQFKLKITFPIIYNKIKKQKNIKLLLKKNNAK